MIVAPGLEWRRMGLASRCRGLERILATIRSKGPNCLSLIDSKPLLARHLTDRWTLLVRLFSMATFTAVRSISLATGFSFQSLAAAMAKIPAPHPKSSMRVRISGLLMALSASRQPFVLP